MWLCLRKAQQIKFKGVDLVRYQLNKRVHFIWPMNQLNLEVRSICNNRTKRMVIYILVTCDQLILESYVYINDAITQFDDKYAHTILPFIDEYVQAFGLILIR